MQRFKAFVMRHFEACVVAVIFCGVLTMNFFAGPRTSLLHFYYLPILVAGYVLGLRVALAAALLSVGFVVLFLVLFPTRFGVGESILERMVQLGVWGGFLILTSYVVGLLYERNEEKVVHIRQAYVGLLEVLSRYVETSERYSVGHSARVSRLAAQVAAELQLACDRVENCRIAGLLHDIGSVEIPLELIRRASDATERSAGGDRAPDRVRVVDSLGTVLKEALPVLDHLGARYETVVRSGQEVPVESFVVAAVDAYDALVAGGPDSSGMPPHEAMTQLELRSGTRFPPEVIAALARVISHAAVESETVTAAPSPLPTSRR
jgi:hypothetical protein